MEVDDEFLPTFHPLRTYLKSIELDDDDLPLNSLTPPNMEPKVNTYSFPNLDWRWIFNFLRSKLKQSKLAILKNIFQSDLLVEDDHLIVEHYINCVYPLSEEKQTTPYFMHLFTLALLIVLLAVTYNRYIFSLLISSILFIIYTTSLHLAVNIVTRVLFHLQNAHNSVRRSIMFLQGIACSERGLTFATSRIIPKNLESRCFPVYTELLQQSLVEYINATAPLSTQACKACQQACLIDFGGCLGEVSSEVVNSVAAESTLTNAKAIFEFTLFLDSELLRRIGCFNSLSNSFQVYWHMHKLLFSWYWNLRRLEVSINQLDALREKLLIGTRYATSDLVKPPNPKKDDLMDSKFQWFLSNLNSLHYHLITWTSRVQELKETVSRLDEDELKKDVSKNLSMMHFFLQNCQICLDEADRYWRPDNNTPTVPFPTPSADLIDTSKAPTLIQISADDPIIEDEVLEATADDSPPVHIDSVFEDEIGLGVDRKTRKEQSSNHQHLLAELNSVISHRLVETREREAKALLKSRGEITTTNKGQPSPIIPTDTMLEERIAAVRDSAAVGMTGCVAKTSTPSELQQRVNLRGQHFDLLVKKPQTRSHPLDLEPTPIDPIEQSSVEVSCRLDGEEKWDAAYVSHLPTFSTNLAGFLRTRKELAEEVFDDMGTGEDLDEVNIDAERQYTNN